MNIERIIVLLVAGLIMRSVSTCQNNYEILYLKGDYKQILQNTQKFTTSDDYYWHALILKKQGKTLDATEVLEAGIGQYMGNKELEIMLGNLYFETGQLPKAKPYLLKYKDNPEVFMSLVKTLEFEGQYATALELLIGKITHDSLNIQYLTHLGDNYYQVDSLDQAVNFYTKVLSLNCHDQLIAAKLANLYHKNKRYKESIETCDIILKNDSTNTKFIKIKGMSAFNMSDFNTAQTCFKYLLNQGDSTEFVLKHLGICEFKNRSYDISREHLLLAFASDSNDFETCYFLGNAFLNSPTPERGLYFFDRADSLLQPDPVVMSLVYYDKHSIYSTLGRHLEALHCYEMAYQYNPKPEYLFYIASLYQNQLKDSKKALIYYEKFLQSLPPKLELDYKFEEKQIIISLRKVAEDNIKLLKEELFFNGKLED